ncbi:hypothetical protein N7463_001269 [Penicillium fimorum]|uniref:Uncharacterized protein n=1 Tax=Penicillium fimorum TaxID=1882269 RepID=A0A9W9Y627_9EURO|nr:hypothetical protein N7463_001269 [Penicillium fimorum]
MSLVLFAKKDRVVNAEIAAFPRTAIPTPEAGDVHCFSRFWGHCPINVVEILVDYLTPRHLLYKQGVHLHIKQTNNINMETPLKLKASDDS